MELRRRFAEDVGKVVSIVSVDRRGVERGIGWAQKCRRRSLTESTMYTHGLETRSSFGLDNRTTVRTTTSIPTQAPYGLSLAFKQDPYRRIAKANDSP
jgi:hypothetical protein